MNIPTFFCIGAPKCATSTLSRVLSRHPEIYVPEKKEINFFNFKEQYEKGLNWYLNTYFKDADKYKAQGEFSTWYLASKNAPKRIYESLGKNVKFIILLRNPAERAFSHFLMEQRAGREDVSNSFDEVIFNRQSERSYNHYIKHGYYAHHLKNYLKWFPRDNLKIILFEDFIGPNKSTIFWQIQEFLNVKPQNLDTDLHVNKAISFKSNFLFKIYISIHKNKYIYDILTKTMKKLLLIKIILKYLVTKKNKYLKYKQIQDINNSIYKQDIQELEGILLKDLSHWYSKKR